MRLLNRIALKHKLFLTGNNLYTKKAVQALRIYVSTAEAGEWTESMLEGILKKELKLQ